MGLLDVLREAAHHHDDVLEQISVESRAVTSRKAAVEAAAEAHEAYMKHLLNEELLAIIKKKEDAIYEKAALRGVKIVEPHSAGFKEIEGPDVSAGEVSMGLS